MFETSVTRLLSVLVCCGVCAMVTAQGWVFCVNVKFCGFQGNRALLLRSVKSLQPCLRSPWNKSIYEVSLQCSVAVTLSNRVFLCWKVTFSAQQCYLNIFRCTLSSETPISLLQAVFLSSPVWLVGHGCQLLCLYVVEQVFLEFKSLELLCVAKHGPCVWI